MRAYFFGNMYLSSIQQGIQAAHVVHEMFNRYPDANGTGATEYLWDWSNDHKTMILLNAGYGENIHALVEIFAKAGNPYPWAVFHEAKESLDGAVTSAGIILPEKIYESAAFLRRLPFRKKEETIEAVREHGQIMVPITEPEVGHVTYELSKWEFDFVQELNNYGMAS